MPREVIILGAGASANFEPTKPPFDKSLIPFPIAEDFFLANSHDITVAANIMLFWITTLRLRLLCGLKIVTQLGIWEAQKE